jgi:membrane protease YdiL (CAAX protease family)
MCCTVSSVAHTYTTNTILAGTHSFGVSVSNAFRATTQKIKDAVTSSIGQGVVGIGLGVCMHKIYAPLTEKILTLWGVEICSSPFLRLSRVSMILFSPLVCVIGPIIEEVSYRGDWPEFLQKKLKSFYINLDLSESCANTAARVTSVFFASLSFGLGHFFNAIVFWCNPVLFLPQVVAATIMGLVFSLAKELSGGLHMPIGMHIGNNTLVWVLYIFQR